MDGLQGGRGEGERAGVSGSLGPRWPGNAQAVQTDQALPTG